MKWTLQFTSLILVFSVQTTVTNDYPNCPRQSLCIIRYNGRFYHFPERFPSLIWCLQLQTTVNMTTRNDLHIAIHYNKFQDWLLSRDWLYVIISLLMTNCCKSSLKSAISHGDSILIEHSFHIGLLQKVNLTACNQFSCQSTLVSVIWTGLIKLHNMTHSKWIILYTINLQLYWYTCSLTVSKHHTYMNGITAVILTM